MNVNTGTGEMYPGMVFGPVTPWVVWAGPVKNGPGDQLFALLSDGRTYRLDRFESEEATTRRWVLVDTLPLINFGGTSAP